jgi:hypothetical protein
LPSFRYACTTPLHVLSMILRSLRDQGLSLNETDLHAEVELYNGDLVALGKGEVFLRPRQAA